LLTPKAINIIFSIQHARLGTVSRMARQALVVSERRLTLEALKSRQMIHLIAFIPQLSTIVVIIIITIITSS